MNSSMELEGGDKKTRPLIEKLFRARSGNLQKKPRQSVYEGQFSFVKEDTEGNGGRNGNKTERKLVAFENSQSDTPIRRESKERPSPRSNKKRSVKRERAKSVNLSKSETERN